MAKKLISINLDEELIEEIDEIANKVGMSRSALANLAMRGVFLGESTKTLRKLFTSTVFQSQKKPESVEQVVTT